MGKRLGSPAVLHSAPIPAKEADLREGERLPGVPIGLPKHGLTSRTFAAAVTFVPLLAIMVVAAIFGLRTKPWHSREIVILALLASTIGAWISWRVSRRVILLAVWSCTVVAMGVGTAGLHFNLYYANYRENLPVVWSSLDLNRPGLSRANESAKTGQIDSARVTLFEYFRTRQSIYPPIHTLLTFLWSPPSNSLEEANRLIASSYTLVGYPAVTLAQDLTWKENPYQDPTWNWDLHTMGFLLPLVRSYLATGEVHYLQRGEDLLLDWVRKNSGYVFQPPSPFTWNDHSTALRLLAWLSFWEVWIRSPLSDDRKMETILSAIIGHANKLSSPAFYTRRHNHGIDQDIALIATASIFPELHSSNEWLSLGTKRLKEQIATIISPNGIHLEHSPAYQLQTLEHLTELYAFARSRSLPDLADSSFRKFLHKMARVTAHMIQPDGRLPPLGDTGRDAPLDLTHPILSRYAKRDPVLRYMLTRGRTGRPIKNAVVYPDEGYAIIRDWSGGGSHSHSSLYFLFTAASNAGLGHKHYDDLSFILFAGGQELIIDPGMYSYKQDAGRKYVVSPYAHNVVVMDGETSDVFFPRGNGKARIEASLVHDRYVLIQAFQENHPRLRHRRTVLFVRPSTFFIIDEMRSRGFADTNIESPRVHRFEQLFHLAPDLEVVSDDTQSMVYAKSKSFNTGPSLQIVQSADGRGTAQIIRGSHDPMLGWISYRHGLLEPTPVAHFASQGIQATFVTRIEIGTASDSPLEGLRAPVQFEATVEESQIIIRWNGRDRWRQLKISRGEEVSVILS